jgi:hypothetical protein
MCVIGLSAAVAGAGWSSAPKEGVVRVEQASTDPKDVCHAHKTLLEAARAKGANDGSDLENAFEDGRHAFNNRKHKDWEPTDVPAPTVIWRQRTSS